MLSCQQYDLSLAVIVNGVIKVVKRNGVGSGVERGLDLAKVAFVIFDLVVIAPLLVVRPHSILTLCQRRDRKTSRYVAPLIIKPQ